MIRVNQKEIYPQRVNENMTAYDLKAAIDAFGRIEKLAELCKIYLLNVDLEEISDPSIAEHVQLECANCTLEIMEDLQLIDVMINGIQD